MPKSKKRKKKMNPAKVALIKEMANKKSGFYNAMKEDGFHKDSGSKVGASGTKSKAVKTSKGDR